MSGGGGSVKETKYEKELAAIAKERYADYKSNFIPAENFLIDRATDSDKIEREGLDKASVDYGARFDEGQAGVANSMNARGAAPGSPAFAMGLQGYARDRGQSEAAGLTDTRNRARDAVASNEGNLIGYGMGQSSDALQGQINVADVANRQSIIDAQAAQASKAAVGQALGQAAGYGLGMYGSAGKASPQVPISSVGGTYNPTFNEATPSLGGSYTPTLGGR